MPSFILSNFAICQIITKLVVCFFRMLVSFAHCLHGKRQFFVHYSLMVEICILSIVAFFFASFFADDLNGSGFFQLSDDVGLIEFCWRNEWFCCFNC